MTDSVTGIHHVTLVTPNLNETVAFYRDVLGLRLLFTKKSRFRPGGRLWRHCFLDAGNGSALHVFEYAEALNVSRPPEGSPWFEGSLQQMALRVSNEDALRTLRAKLQAASIEVSDIDDFGEVQAIHFRDNNGMLLEAACWTTDLG